MREVDGRKTVSFQDSKSWVKIPAKVTIKIVIRKSDQTVLRSKTAWHVTLRTYLKVDERIVVVEGQRL